MAPQTAFYNLLGMETLGLRMERAFAIMNQLKIPQIVSNIGDTKTLIVHPESTLAAHSTEAEKRDAAVYDDMIRVSVGIEDIEDLVKDFEAAIADTAEML